MHSEQIPETGEKGLALLSMSHFIVCAIFFLASFLMWFDRDVWLTFGFLKEVLWVPNLALNVVLVRPV